MKIENSIREYLAEIEVRKYTPRTIKGYRNNLGLFLRFCVERAEVEDVEDLTLGIVKQFTQFMVGQGKKGTYINSILKNIKSFIQYNYDEGYGGFNTRRNFKWCKEDKPVIVVFKAGQVKKMLADCGGHDFVSVRDRAILTTFFETGVRCLELCCIKPADIHNDFIVIQGKNHKQRVVPVTPVLAKAFLRYNDVSQRFFDLKSHDDYYFLSFHGRQLTNSAVEHIIKKHGSKT